MSRLDHDESEPLANGRSRRIVDHGRDVTTDAGVLRDDLRALHEEVAAWLRERLARGPYSGLAIAGAVGYVLGGGLPRPLVRLGTEIGLRIAIRALTTGPAPDARSPAPATFD